MDSRTDLLFEEVCKYSLLKFGAFNFTLFDIMIHNDVILLSPGFNRPSLYI